MTFLDWFEAQYGKRPRGNQKALLDAIEKCDAAIVRLRAIGMWEREKDAALYAAANEASENTERWLRENPDELESIRRGMRDAKEGRIAAAPPAGGPASSGHEAFRAEPVGFTREELQNLILALQVAITIRNLPEWKALAEKARALAEGMK